MDKLSLKKKQFERRRVRIKNKVRRNNEVLRLCISRSNQNFYAQIIDDKKGHTLVALSTLSKEFSEIKNRGNIESAKKLLIENGLNKKNFFSDAFVATN